MSNKTIRSMFIALFAGLVLALATGCESPEESEPAVAEDDESSGDEAADEESSAENEGAPEERAALEGAPGEGSGDQEMNRLPDQGEMDENPLQQAGGGGGGEVSDEQLDRFGEALEAVSELEEEAGDPQEQMRQAETQQEQQQVQQELMGQLQGAVEDSGMEFTEFLTLSQRIQQDPQLQQRLSERVDLEGLRGAGPGGPPQGGAQPDGAELQREAGDDSDSETEGE